MNRKVLIGLIILSFLLLELVLAITADSQTPPSASAYVASITVSSNPFVLNTATLPAINQLGSNIRFFQYPNLTGQLYAYEQQLPQTIATVNTVESTGWKVLPYWQNGELVMNMSMVPIVITISNTQAQATPSPFDQFINITLQQVESVLGTTAGSNLWNQAESDSFLNVLFISSSGEFLYAWVQSFTSSWVAFWVKLPNGVPANGAVNITMVFTTSNQYPYTGLAPYLTSTYGQYDNGQYVFPVYYNFAGTSLPQGLTFTVLSSPSGASGSYKVSNSINITNINGADFWDNDFMISLVYIDNTFNFATTPLLFETIVKGIGGSALSSDGGWSKAGLVYMNSITTSSTSNGEVDAIVTAGNGYAVQWQSGTGYIAPSANSNGGSISYPTVLAMLLTGSSVTGFYGSSLNNLVQITSAVSPSGYTGTGYVGLWDLAHSTSGSFWAVFELLLARPWPPNGVMPSTKVVGGGTGTGGGQYLAWAYRPTSNVINVTLHVTSNTNNTAGVVLYSPNIGNLQSDDSGSFYGLLISFNGNILYHAPGSSYELLKSNAFPTPNVPFTMTVILDQSSGNVSVSYVYINGTAYSVGLVTPMPWTSIGYIGLRASPGNSLHVSYFAVSPAPYGGAEQFVNNAESASWKVLPYWQNGELVVNSTGAGTSGQYIVWKYSPISNVINVTIRVVSYPSKSTYAGIAFYGTGLQNSPYFMVAFYTGAVYYFTGSSSTSLATFTTPNPPFTMSVILVENSAGNVTVQSVYVNGSTTYSLNTNVPFPWSQIAYIGIRADPGNLFYVSYFAVTQLLDAYSLVTNPVTNTPYTGTVYVAVFPYPISYDVYVSPAPVTSSQSPLPVFSPSFTSTTTLYPVVSTSTSSGTVNVIPSIGAWTSANASLFLTTLAVGNQIYVNIPMAESTSWKVYPYWQNGQLVVNSTGAGTSGQYIAWRYSPINNITNITVHITTYPTRYGSPGIEILSSNVGDQASDNPAGFNVLLINFYGGNIVFHSITATWEVLASSLPQPNPNYPFTFTVILTENSAGNVTVQSIYINGTAYSVNVNTPFPWSQIGYVGIRADHDNLFYVSYFAVNSIPLVSPSGVTSFNFYSPFSLSYTITNTSITVQNTQLVYGENYLIIPGTNGIIGASFAFYNVTDNVPVLAISSSPVSVTYNAPARTFTVVSPSQTFLVSPYGTPEQNYQTLTGGVIILPQSGKVTFYASYQPNLVPSSIIVSSSSTGSLLPPPTATTSINPNQATVVINGSVYLTAPWLVHYSIPSVNSSVTAYLVYNYSANKPVLVLSSPTNVNVNVTFTASNGTVLLSESVVSPTTVTLPVATGNVTVKTTNSTITIPITYQQFNVVSLTNAVMNSPIMGAVAVLLLFFVSFYIGFVFRTVPNAMALGAVVYITAVAPFLLAIGFPMSIVMLTVVLAVVALIYAIWALRVTNVERY